MKMRFCAIVLPCVCLSAINSLQADQFFLPESGDLYIQAAGGSAGAVTDFGVGTSPLNHVSLITGLPGNPVPTTEVFVGNFLKDEEVVFSMRTLYLSSTYWAFSNDFSTDASLYAFRDVNNSLGWGGQTLELIDTNKWIMHLDDAASYTFDDDDDDVLIQIRLEPIPEPATALLLLGGGLALWRKRRV